MPVEFKNIGSNLSKEESNGLSILKNLDVDDVNDLKEVLKLGVPGVVGPETLKHFVDLCAAVGLDLSEAGVNTFKNVHNMGNAGASHGVIGPQTAKLYYQTVLVLLDRHDTVQCSFPFTQVPAASWTSGPRAFASNRNGGSRAHAGCDLYFPAGTKIHAIADGKVTLGPYPFYAATFALEVDHGDFLARYGEIQTGGPAKQGDKVKRGDVIARVGHLIGISVPSDMLHLELYDKQESGPLTVASGSCAKRSSDGVPFLRRRDLIDPTERLNEWKNRLP